MQPRSGDFARGLETTKDVRSSDPLAFEVFAEARVRNGHAKRRKGYRRVYRFAAPSVLMDFDGTDDCVTLGHDPRPLPFGTRFTAEWLVYTDTFASRGVITGGTGASCGIVLSHETTGAIKCVVTDSAAATTTLSIAGVSAGAAHPIQLVRDGASLTLRIHGYTSATGTMSATNKVLYAAMAMGKDNGAAFYNGAIDFFRARQIVQTSQTDGWCRLPDPRAPSVLFDFVMEPDANGVVMDRGPYAIHGATSGSPATNRAPIAVNPVPVLAIGMTTGNDASRQAYCRAGPYLYPVNL